MCVDSGVDYETALDLMKRAKIQDILQDKKLGGYDDWTIDLFLSEDVWTELGGKAGLKAESKKLLTIIAATGRKVMGRPAPINPMCAACGEFKFQHTGDRCKLEPVLCKCPAAEVEGDEELGRPAKRVCATPRGMSDLDPARQGMLETYERKMEVIKARYAELGPKAVVSRLLGADVSMCAGDDETVTGETGGKLLLCYLFSVKDEEAWLSAGVKAWLEAQKPKYALLFPAQKACIEQAIIFLPKLERGLTAAAAARAPAPSFDTPDAASAAPAAASPAVPAPLVF